MIIAALPTSLPVWIILILPFLASSVIGIFQKSDASHPSAKVINALISVVFFLMAAAIVFALAGPLSGNLSFDILSYLTLVGLLMQTSPCKQLCEAMTAAIPSPFMGLFNFFEQNFMKQPIQLQATKVVSFPDDTVEIPALPAQSITPPTTLPPGN